MFSQKDIFLSCEGDNYFARNRAAYSANNEDDDDDIVTMLRNIDISPNKILEIGCSNGKHLGKMQQSFEAECYGIDPSRQAIEEGAKLYPGISLQVGTADELPYNNGNFDTIILGFCLYLCDRKDLFKIAYEVDRCLTDTGTLIIKDFYPPFPYKKTYSHYDGVYSYKMDYSRMFLWNPAYWQIANIVSSHSGYLLRDQPDEKIAITVLRKSEDSAYPDAPFK